MKKRWAFFILVGFFILGVILIGFKASRRNQPLRYPGEYEKQQAIWMQWPSDVYNSGDHPVYPVIITLLKNFARFIRVNLMTQSLEETIRVKDLLRKSGYTGTKVHFYLIPHFSIWTRDVGPIFVKNGNKGLHIVDFGFNNYSRGGDPNYIRVEGRVDRSVAKTLRIPIVPSNLISEGGAIESNGRGVLMVTEAVVRKRNPGLSREQIEMAYRRVLGVRKIIWLQKGLAEDDRITSGHINEFARFVSPNTVLLGQVLPEDRERNPYTRESYRRLETNNRILRNATDQDGKPFRIIRVPMPPTIYAVPDETGETPVRSYLNFAMTNGAVVMPTYWKSGRPAALKTVEDRVKHLFEKIFPGRKIVGIDAEAVNRWGGGIHCITQHMPAER